MTDQERRQRLRELKERHRETVERNKRLDLETARVLAQLERAQKLLAQMR
jgi:hypothetical protein